MAVFGALSIGRAALLAHERALATTGQNIANAETPGYRRQTAVLEAQNPAGGEGVRVAGIEQAIDRFLEARLRDQESRSAGADVREEILSRVEELFGVGETSVAESLDAFWAAAQRLADHPEDLAVRNDLLAYARELASRIRGVAEGLARQQREVDDRLSGEVGEANAALARIARLNREIASLEVGGDRANELRDERDAALLDLAEHLEIRTTENANGTVDVQLEVSGLALVIGSDAQELVIDVSSANGLDGDPLSAVRVRLPSGATIPFPGEPGGRLGALLGLRDGDLTGRGAELDSFALALRDSVNAVQTDAAGRDLDGLVGNDFFAGTGAGDLTVALGDPRGIAAALGANPADNTNALALVAVRSTRHASLGDVTLGDYWAGLQGAAGTAARRSADDATVQSSVRSSLQQRRDAVSGVSLEEEFTDLIRFQRGFQAAAQLVSVSDRLLDDLMNLVRT